ncbi:hypothetical protein GEMRC1_007261 [Eukaryota sp. GEM-RC1]
MNHYDFYKFPIDSSMETRIQFETSFMNRQSSVERKWDKYLSKHATSTDPFTVQPVVNPKHSNLSADEASLVTLERQSKNQSYYQATCGRHDIYSSSAVDQIKLDLDRTFPENSEFRSPCIIAKLRRVLTVFSVTSLDIGYVQSLNYLVGMLLLIVEEEEAYWILTCILDKYLPREYFSKNLAAVMVDQRVLSALCTQKIGSRFTGHLEECGAPLDLLTTDWFMCLFSKTLTSQCVYRIWDAFFFEGVKVLFRYALAVLMLSKNKIMEAYDIVKVSSIINSFPSFVYDPDLLSKYAFNKLGSFPFRTIEELRVSHGAAVNADLARSQQLRDKAKIRVVPIPPQIRKV